MKILVIFTCLSDHLRLSRTLNNAAIEDSLTLIIDLKLLLVFLAVNMAVLVDFRAILGTLNLNGHFHNWFIFVFRLVFVTG